MYQLMVKVTEVKQCFFFKVLVGFKPPTSNHITLLLLIFDFNIPNLSFRGFIRML